MNHYDIVIVGGGLVGAGLAAALRHANLKIALVDQRLPTNTDPRLFALNDNSCQFLKNIGVWAMVAEDAAPIRQVHVSNQGKFGAVRIKAEDMQLVSLGHVVPAYKLESALNEILMSLPYLTLYRPAKLNAMTTRQDGASLKIEMEDKEISLESSIVIGADGTESTVRKLMNIATSVVEYKQSAIVTRTKLQRAHQHIAYERFTPTGAIAMLPLVGDECATIWSADKDTITRLMSYSEQQFLNALQLEFGYRLGRFEGIAHRYQFPLRLVCADKNVEDCVVLLGNSAHTMHPVAAQGFNLALYEVALLSEILTAKPIDLSRVNQCVRAHQTASVRVSHWFSTLFSNQSNGMSWLLQLGMVSLDISAPVKRKFVERIIGRSGSVPSLLLSANE